MFSRDKRQVQRLCSQVNMGGSGDSPWNMGIRWKHRYRTYITFHNRCCSAKIGAFQIPGTLVGATPTANLKVLGYFCFSPICNGAIPSSL